MKNIMFENEMEEYLIYNGYNIEDEGGCLDSTLVIEEAIKIGYKNYLLSNEDNGKYHDTYIFILE